MTPEQNKPAFARPRAKQQATAAQQQATSAQVRQRLEAFEEEKVNTSTHRASPLAGVISGKQPHPRRTIVYGVGGVGKSSFAADSEAPIFIDLEGGLEDIDCARFPPMKTFGEVQAAIETLRTEPHDYKTLVVDSLEWLEQLIWRVVCAEGDPQAKVRKQNLENIEAFPFGRGYMIAVPKWKWFLESLDTLRRERGMAVILIGHSKIEKYEAPDANNYDRYVPGIDKRAAATLIPWADECLFATWEIFVSDVDERKGKGKASGTGRRILRTVEQPFAVAKNRLRGMPDEIPLDWAEYAKHFQCAANETEVSA